MKVVNPTILFNTRFNDLHKIITELLDTNQKRDFYSCLNEIRDRAEHSPLFDRIHEHYGDDLRTINSIRNILIHKNDWIAIPDATLDVLQEAIDGISQIEKNFHKRAIEVFGKTIFIGKDIDTIAELTSTMSLRGFTHIPIYTMDDVFRGVFSLKSLLYWVTNTKGMLDTSLQIRHIPIDTKSSEYLFIANDTPVSAIEAHFREYSKKRKKLGAIFLTQSGTQDDPINGIITAWDLPLIYEQIQF